MPHTNRVAIVAVILLGSIACSKDSTEPEPTATGPVSVAVVGPSWLDTLVGGTIVPADNPSTVEGIALGRRLFHETALSDDYSQSCASCHLQANSFSDPLPFSVGTNGATGTRNAMAVVNLAWDGRFFWDGRAQGLEAQAHDPVVNMLEMRNTWPVVLERLQAEEAYMDGFEAAFGTRTIDSVLVTKAIAQFERTLVSFNSRFDRFQYEGDSTALNAQEQHGLDLFMRDAKCDVCHNAPLMFDRAFRDNGLDAAPVDGGLGALTGVPSDWGRFKVPTLRNIAVTAPYMHDSRFNTLEEVVDFYANDVHLDDPNLDVHMGAWQLGLVNLTEQDQADLVAFLHTLTDDAFLTNPAFGPP